MTAPSTPTTATLDTLRTEMLPSRKLAYFDHAALSPLPARTAQRIRDYVDEVSSSGDTQWLSWVDEVERVTRGTAAKMLGASPDEIALVGNTTVGVNLVAEGLDWREGDNVVTQADEFPTNLYPWLHLESRGVEVRRLPTDRGRLDLDALRNACDSRTRVVAVSWVGYQTGYRLDLDAIADITHTAGGLLLVDAIQGLGVFPLDVRKTPIDFLASGGHKWLLGTEGAGIAYVRQVHLDKLRPTGVGWNSVARPLDYTHIELKFKPTAGRYEGGTANMSGFLALGQSLELLHSIGAETLSQQVLDYTDMACERLRSAGAQVITDRDRGHRNGDHRSGILFFELPGRDPVEVRRKCLAAGIVLSTRAGKLRIAPHAYNTEEDMDRLIEVLQGA